jgi:hypothetical protein
MIKLYIYVSGQSGPLQEVQITNLIFDFKEHQFMVDAGYSRTPVLTSVLPCEMSIYPAEMRLRFTSTSQASQFLDRFYAALDEANRRINAMLD